MPRNLLYIINPVSGTKTKKDIQQLIEKKTAGQNISCQVFPSVASGDYSFLYPIIKEQSVTDVIIAGGDGTVSQVVSSLINCDVNFGIIPCGSGNGLAYTAKIPKQPAKALDIIFNGKSAPIDGFYINNQFACMLCGLGFDAKVAHDFSLQPKRGLTTYVKQVIRNFFSAKAFLFELENKEIKFRISAFFICIANSNQFGNNFTIAPKASLSDGLLDVVIVTEQSKLSVLLQTLRQLWGKNKLQPDIIADLKDIRPDDTTSRGVIYFQTDKLSISNLSHAPLHMDGEPAETPEKLIIEVKHNCFRLIQP
jgi:YegS/Rv2252/BmrU family lipid kinase